MSTAEWQARFGAPYTGERTFADWAALIYPVRVLTPAPTSEVAPQAR